MGITAQFEHPDYIQAYKQVLLKCKEYNIVPGVHVVKPDYQIVEDRIKEGFIMIAYSLDITVLGTYCREAIKKIKRSN